MEFSLHTYLKQLQETGASSEYIEAVRRNAKPLAECGLPVILSLGHLAHVTGAQQNVLWRIIKREIDPYRVFAIRKRNGGKRYICVPEPSLLALQRWIHTNILCSSQGLSRISPNSTAYKPKSSHLINAKRHLDANCILKFDITRFFESVSERQVYQVFRSLGYRALVAFCFTRLCTRVLPAISDMRLHQHSKRWMPGRERNFLSSSVVGHLPQGAPTSPMLANLVCEALDNEIEKIAAREGLVYSRYADDMTLSGGTLERSALKEVIAELSSIVGRYGFRINPDKTSIARNGSRKIVTGLSVDGAVLRLPRAYKDDLRQDLHYIGKHGLEGHCARIGYKNHFSYVLRLAGRIRYLASVEPSIGERMMTKFSILFPQFAELERLIF